MKTNKIFTTANAVSQKPLTADELKKAIEMLENYRQDWTFHQRMTFGMKVKHDPIIINNATV